MATSQSPSLISKAMQGLKGFIVGLLAFPFPPEITIFRQTIGITGPYVDFPGAPVPTPPADPSDILGLNGRVFFGQAGNLNVDLATSSQGQQQRLIFDGDADFSLVQNGSALASFPEDTRLTFNSGVLTATNVSTLGFRTDWSFDLAGTRPWFQIESRRDAQDRTDVVTTVNDDGTKLVTDYDQTGAAIWSHTNSLWDARGWKDVEATFYRDGRQAHADWDLLGQQPWWSLETVLAADGRPDFQRVTHDGANGRTENDWDLLGQQPWWLAETVTAPSGHPDFQRLTLDAGAGRVENDRDLTGAEAWHRKTEFFAANRTAGDLDGWQSIEVVTYQGSVVYKKVTWDNGSAREEIVDPLNRYDGWYQHGNEYSPGG